MIKIKISIYVHHTGIRVNIFIQLGCKQTRAHFSVALNSYTKSYQAWVILSDVQKKT